MKFRSQLIVGYTALLFVTIVTGAASMLALRITTSRLERVAHELALDMIAVERLRFQAEQVVATSRGYLLTGDPKTRERFDDAVRRVDQSLAILTARRADFAEEVNRIEESTRTYVAAARRAAERRSETDDPRAVVPFFEQTLTPDRDHFDDAITGFAQREQAAFEHASHHAHDFAERTRKIIGVMTTLGFALGIGLAWLSIRKLNALYAREREATSTAQRASDARDELLAVVSHDLRSPLSAIVMGAALLDDCVTEQSARKHVATIQRASDQMLHLIDELLDVAKLENGTLELRCEPCTVASLFDVVGSLFGARAKAAGIELAIDRDSTGIVRADQERLVRVCSNLVGNAIKFTPRSGSITLAARRDGGDVRMTVTDTGPGIADADVPHLFERYWQGRRRGRGSVGLGLYICKQIVEAHHGRIGVDTRPGEGSTFWLVLPAYDPPKV